MKERLTTLLCALAALALFIAMFVHGDEQNSWHSEVPRPTSAEEGPNGYRGAMLWLEHEHIRSVSVRERFNKLIDVPATGNLLLVTLPVATAFKTEELRWLNTWTRAGNTVLILAALADSPDWAVALGRSGSGDLSLLTGLELERVRGAGHQGSSVTLVPNGSYPYFDGVRSAVVASSYPGQDWAVKIPYDGFVLSLAHAQSSSHGVLWMRPSGKGRIIVSGLGSLFANRDLGRADNGRLLANMVSASLGPDGVVLFDDMHQGLAAAYDPAKFYSDPRLYETMGILAALWLCWVLGATTLQVPATRASLPREAELVQATGGFLARVLTVDAGARGLFEHFFRRMGGGARWELLEGRVSAAELQQLKDWYAAACARRRVPLRRLHDLLVKIAA